MRLSQLVRFEVIVDVALDALVSEAVRVMRNARSSAVSSFSTSFGLRLNLALQPISCLCCAVSQLLVPLSVSTAIGTLL